MKQTAEKYIRQALEMGATDAVFFDASQICWDSRTLLKCMYGCTDWGKNHTCPSRPNNPSMAELREMFSRYRWGIIIHTKEKNICPMPAIRLSLWASGPEPYRESLPVSLLFCFYLSW